MRPSVESGLIATQPLLARFMNLGGIVTEPYLENVLRLVLAEPVNCLYG
jgi:hypothetical protein